MPCKITFVINGKKIKIKSYWENLIEEEIKIFCDFIEDLQNGYFEKDIINSIDGFGKTSKDNKTSKKILSVITGKDNYLNKSIISSEEVGQENF